MNKKVTIDELMKAPKSVELEFVLTNIEPKLLNMGFYAAENYLIGFDDYESNNWKLSYNKDKYEKNDQFFSLIISQHRSQYKVILNNFLFIGVNFWDILPAIEQNILKIKK